MAATNPNLARDDVTLLWLLKNSKLVYKSVVAAAEADKDGNIVTGKTAEEMRAEAAAISQRLLNETAARENDVRDLAELIEDVEGTTLLYIDSSAGTVFKNNNVSTRLTVILYRGGTKITNATAMHEVYGPGAYLQWSWRRMDDDRFGIISSDDERIIDDGFTFILSSDDVDTKVTFTCELITD